MVPKEEINSDMNKNMHINYVYNKLISLKYQC